MAQNDTNRASAIDGRTTRHEGYDISRKKRMRAEEIFDYDNLDSTSNAPERDNRGLRKMDS